MELGILDLFYNEVVMKKKATTNKYKLNQLQEEARRILDVRKITNEDVMNFMEKYEIGIHDLTFLFNQLGIKLTGIIKEK